MLMDFASLAGADEWEEFRGAFLEKRPIVRAVSAAPDRFRPLWAEWQLEAVARFTPASHDHERFRLISRGKQVPPRTYFDRAGIFREEAFSQLRAGGASVALGNFEDYSNLALAITRRLEAEFHCPAQVNLYVTPGASQGLGAHVDPHDVLILQIQGEKSWDVYDGPGPDANFRETVIKPGGWLFLPKGTRHEVRNLAGETSVHFTIGFHPLTWGEVFQRALNRARVATPALNEALLPGAGASPAAAAVDARLNAILPWVNVQEHVAAYYANFPALGVQIPDGHALSVDRLGAADTTTMFCWRDEAVLSGGAIGFPEVTMPYRRFPIRLKSDLAGALKRMVDCRTFAASEIDVGDPASSALLCRFLASLGVLEGV